MWRSTNPEDIAALMDSEEADLLITDPPYNVNYQGGTKEKLKIENDAMDNAAFLEFLQKAFESVYDVMKPGAPFYVYYASRQHINFETALNNAQLKVRQQLIWVKNALIIGRQDINGDTSHFYTAGRKVPLITSLTTAHRQL